MRKTTLIKNKIGTFLKPYGFVYAGYDRSVSTWSFEKREGEKRQEISIGEIHGDALRLYFYNKQTMIGFTSAADIIPEEEDSSNIFDAWEYEGESEFVQILDYFCEVIEKYGFACLVKKNKEMEAVATASMEKDLYDNHQSWTQEYEKRYGLSVSDDPKETFLKMQEIIAAEQGKPFKEAIEVMSGLAAIYGSVFEHCLNWYWEWNEEQKICWINKDSILKDRPLTKVIGCWESQPDAIASILHQMVDFNKVYQENILPLQKK